jgi:ATP-dependent Clp protease adaptor protein ClpS
MPPVHNELLGLLVVGVSCATRFAYLSYSTHARRKALRGGEVSVEMSVVLDVVARDGARRLVPAIGPEQLLLAASLDDEVGDALEALGTEPVVLREALAAHLPQLCEPTGDRDGHDLPCTPTLARVLVAARARAAATGRKLAPIHLLPELCGAGRACFAAAQLEKIGVSAAMDLTTASAVGAAPPGEGAAPPYRRRHAAPSVELVLESPGPGPIDDLTEVLRRTFALTWIEADHVALTALHKGRAVIDAHPAEEAARALEQASRRASGFGVPLRLTLDPGAGGRSPRARLRVAAEMSIALRLATLAAARRRNPEVAVEHLLYAILFDTALGARLRAAGGQPPGAIQHALERTLEALEIQPLEVVPPFSRALNGAVHRAAAAARSAGDAQITAAHLVSAMSGGDDPTDAATVLAEHGVTRESLARTPAAPGRPGAVPAPEGHLGVVFYNDERTTMAAVIQILVQVFEKAEVEAMHLMLSVHHQGQALVGVYPAEVARHKVAQVHALCREHGWPLQLSAAETVPG